MTMTQATSEYFEKIAGSWDQISAGYFGQAVRDTAISKAWLRPEMAVADIGSGTGFIAAGLAPLVKRVHVVDGSPAMLEAARKNLGQFDNVEYHQADGSSLPFPEGSLDAVFANMYLHHTADPLAAIQEMVRTLRPGGRLVITDMDEHPYTWLKEEMADEWQAFNRKELRAWLKAAGMVNIIVDCTGDSCCAELSNPTLVDSREREAKISVFVATGTRKMTMRATVQENYSAIAQSGSSCCCSPSADDPGQGGCCSDPSSSASCCGTGGLNDFVTFASGYGLAELSTAPKEAANLSLGCGNPLAMAALQPGEVVLDIGSGGGLDAFLASQRVGPTGQVIGVDMTPAMLERARATAARMGIEQVEFRQGYAEELPLTSETVDVILSNCVINLSEDKGVVFQEAFRVLKPGGRLEISDMVASAALPHDLHENSQGWAECITGALPEQEYLDLIAQAGFQNISTRRSTSMGSIQGVSVYSLIVSARKPGCVSDSGDSRLAAQGGCC